MVDIDCVILDNQEWLLAMVQNDSWWLVAKESPKVGLTNSK